MKYNILILLVFLSNTSNAQMFDYLKNKQKIRVLSLTEEVDSLYNEFGSKIKELILWEIGIIKKAHKKIEYEAKDLPLKKKLEIQYKIFSEIEYEIAEREIELDFWYLEKLDYLNFISNKENDSIEFFKPETTVEGRFIEIVIKELIEDEKKIKLISEKVNNRIDNGLVAAEITAVSLSFYGKPGEGAAVIIGGIIFTIEALKEIQQFWDEKKVKKVLKKYIEYATNGYIIDPRKVHLKLASKIQTTKK